ncbi:hypothetical protein DAPPUDRAFT_314776 [Daphnia pulex]|uniref:Uncharacterized protein n=1 Tax=Daphnia pulex TaxID=6669 RepID=E9G7F5_DAPPU|nr:hypothetical protein DAPPUDRAFT_314776 [Daphnia pulex]|eukprot:EFX84653.1 hypothetical protein DAPPUDRAFT_314776 [Daphnia pulex]
MGCRKRRNRSAEKSAETGGHPTFSESEPPNLHKIPVPPNQNIRPPKASRRSANADPATSYEDTATSTNFEAERELQGMTSQSPDNQLGYTELYSLEVENCGYESDSLEQVILPGTKYQDF